MRGHKQTFPDQDRYATLFAAQKGIIALADAVPKLRASSGERERMKAHADQLRLVIHLAEVARKTAVQKLVDQVAGTANGYYQKIHPGEQIGVPELEVTERGTASLALSGEFYGHRGDPRGHYSEGHLDSLGLCLFLAIRRLHHNQRPDLGMLVLDDVLHSVDGDHRRRTAKLIVEEFSDHQIFITTHDQLWFEYLKTATKGRCFLAQHIVSWTIDDGPTISEYRADYEWLVSAEGRASPPARRIIAAGRILEETLQNLCNNLGVAVPFRLRGDYTIDPLWTSFVSFMKKNSQFAAATRDPVLTIDELRSLRNLVGAHWNQWAEQLTASEAEDFCESVLEFRDLSYCDQCGDFIARIAGLDGVWSCEKEHKRYDRRPRAAAEKGQGAAASADANAAAKEPEVAVPKRIM